MMSIVSSHRKTLASHTQTHTRDTRCSCAHVMSIRPLRAHTYTHRHTQRTGAEACGKGGTRAVRFERNITHRLRIRSLEQRLPARVPLHYGTALSCCVVLKFVRSDVHGKARICARKVTSTNFEGTGKKHPTLHVCLRRPRQRTPSKTVTACSVV